MSHETLENLLSETRTFLPSAEFAAEANAQPFIYAQANKDRIAFWEEAAELLQWERHWDMHWIGNPRTHSGSSVEPSTHP